MIGNDVVDLQLAKSQSRWERKGFLEKVFTTSEQVIIRSSQNPDFRVWLLWSMKEAAYKAHQRKFSLPRRLNWRVQECEITTMGPSGAKGLVTIGKEIYLTTSQFTPNVVHTVAVDRPEKEVISECISAPSEELKKKLCFKIARHYSLDPWDLSIQKEPEGIPFISFQKRVIFESFSSSGHGRYSSYAFCL